MKTKGKLVKWNKERGFGFIQSPKVKGDIFIHISEFRKMSRAPLVSDVIFFDLVTEKDGKNKAINAKIEGVAEKQTQHNPKKQKKKSGIVNQIIFLAIISFLIIGAYKTYPNWSSKVVDSIPVNFIKEDFTGFRCKGKRYCSQMTSCKEARFYLKNCPNVKIDGDHDGVPCESQWCN